MKNGKNVSVMMVVILSLLWGVAACQEQENEEEQAEVELPSAPIEISFEMEPEEGMKAGDSVELYVEVIQDGEVVEDAEEVMFEIREAEDDIGAGDEEGDEHDHADDQTEEDLQGHDGDHADRGEGHEKEDGAHDHDAESHHESNHDTGSDERDYGHDEHRTDQHEHDQQGMDMNDYDADVPMLEAEHEGNGVYHASHTFEEEGTYEIIYHVMGGGMHRMNQQDPIKIEVSK